jgi:hypothetical protein
VDYSQQTHANKRSVERTVDGSDGHLDEFDEHVELDHVEKLEREPHILDFRCTPVRRMSAQDACSSLLRHRNYACDASPAPPRATEPF